MLGVVGIHRSSQVFKPASRGLIRDGPLRGLMPALLLLSFAVPVDQLTKSRQSWALTSLTVLSPKKLLRSSKRMSSRSCCAQARLSLLYLGRFEIS